MDHAFPVLHAPLPNHFPRPHAPLQAATAAGRMPCHAQSDHPFMNNMDEISFWITTKQAPCLFNYDNVTKRQYEELQCSKPKSVLIETPSPKKKRKRKRSLLDDESVSTEKQQNVYFETSQNKNQQTILGTCKSDSLGSDLDFNIKSASIKKKLKKTKINKSTRTTLHKKNKIVTSTPKATGHLRRSLRKAQSNNNSHLNDSLKVFNCEIVNSNNTKCNNIISDKERAFQSSKAKKTPELFAAGDHSIYKNKCNDTSVKQSINLNNGQFDDMSDVSGFTANYIRSTKIHSSKKLRNNVRSKGNRNIIKELQQNSKKEDNTMIVCMNKSVNTGLPKAPVLNCSTDSSQNVINLVTLKNNEKSARVSRTTSLLKFMDTRNGKTKPVSCSKTTNNINISFHSKSSITSRYPKRHKNSSGEDFTPAKFEKKCQQNKITLDKRCKVSKNSNEFNNSDRKENPEDELISRTRSGKYIGLTLRQPENSVLVLSNSMEPVSSLASINVATSPNDRTPGRSKRKNNSSSKQADNTKKQDKSSNRRESLRDKSGFAACFSDSDEDNEQIKEKKYFC